MRKYSNEWPVNLSGSASSICNCSSSLDRPSSRWSKYICVTREAEKRFPVFLANAASQKISDKVLTSLLTATSTRNVQFITHSRTYSHYSMRILLILIAGLLVPCLVANAARICKVLLHAIPQKPDMPMLFHWCTWADDRPICRSCMTVRKLRMLRS